MPLIVLEGVDNVGKDTLIENFIRERKNIIVRHFSDPKGRTNEERIEYQRADFLYEFRKQRLREIMRKTPSDVYIWNRSHIGEWVYGKIYRDYDPEWIFNMERVFGFNDDPSIFLVLLEAEAEFSLKNDDGLSFTSNLEKRKYEMQRFREAFERSGIINKKIINVTKNVTQFKKEQDIHGELLDFIGTSTH